MDPVSIENKLKEQIERENLTRRKYSSKWGEITNKDLYKFYNQNFINFQLKNDSNLKDKIIYNKIKLDNSNCISKEIYKQLYDICRCGRLKYEGHIIKCLQKTQNKYLKGVELNGENSECTGIKNIVDQKSDKEIHKIPETSGGMIGWPVNKYRQWEQSTHYISPKTTMPGYKINDHPYSNIFLG